MRVLVATDTIGSLSSARAGALVATGWPGAEVTVVSLGEAGAGFPQALADQLGVELESGVLGDRVVSVARSDGDVVVGVENAAPDTAEVIAYHATSAALGYAVRQVLDGAVPTTRLVVDLAGDPVHDGGAGFLHALGAEADVELDRGVAGLADLSRLDLTAVRQRLGGAELIGVVPSEEIDQLLLGLRGITSLRSRDPRADRARLLETDTALTTFARLAAPDQAERAGAGASGGLGFAVLALGGRLVTGPQFAFESSAVRDAVRSTDLVVTGCTVFDFARRGGGVVAEAARIGVEQLCPCIAVAAEVLIGGREMRTMGIESAYPLREPSLESPHGGDVSEAELMATARRIGRSWRW
ncbi:MAG: glycerate kinase [Propionibacteriaceae bacterium]